MINFCSDYTEGCHPRILKALTQTNFEQTAGYGCDPYCETARSILKKQFEVPDADVHFLVGGTQANATVIASVLRPHQGVLCAETAHINVHESGAVEATGHKVLALKSETGKLTARQIEDAVNAHYNDATHEHQVQPGMVYLSHPAENGALYTKQELTAISSVCREYHLPLYLDGARLGYGLAARGTDLTGPEIASLCDILLVGGTKCGALFGEAVILRNPALKSDFRYILKQHGGMLAKGRLLGLQFLTLFTDNLYGEICEHADALAYRIADALAKNGIPVLCPSDTNQQFPIFTEEQIKFLREKYLFDFWCRIDDERAAYRICTSWATTAEQTDALIESLRAVR